MIADGSASESNLHRMKARWHGKKLKSLFQFFVSYFKENSSSDGFFFSQVVSVLVSLKNFQISKFLQTCSIKWVSDLIKCLHVQHLHYSRDLDIKQLFLCMQVYLKLFWVFLLLILYLFKDCVRLFPK